MTRHFFLTLLLLLLASPALWAQKSDPQVDPMAYYTDKDGDQSSNEIKDGEAPLEVTFKANPSDMGDWTPSYEWHFIRKTSDGNQEMFVRYDEETTYTFSESGSYQIVLKTYLRDGDITAELSDKAVSVSIADSKLEFPNAFSPNGDNLNEIYQAKKDYKSIISFRAIILNRWGQKLYEWHDPAGGWDGKYHGHDCKEGVYFVLVEAKGADGKNYKIRKDVNLIRGHSGEKGGTTTTGGGE